MHVVGTVAFLVLQLPFKNIHELDTFMKYQREFLGLFRQRNQVRFELDIGVKGVAEQLVLMPDPVVVPLYSQPLAGFDKSGFMALPDILKQVGE